MFGQVTPRRRFSLRRKPISWRPTAFFNAVLRRAVGLNRDFDLFLMSYPLPAFEFTVRLSYSDTLNPRFEGIRCLAGSDEHQRFRTE